MLSPERKPEKKMKDGFVRVGAATPESRVADPAFNGRRAAEAAARAAGAGVKVLAFPELTLTGYTCADLFFQRTLQREAEAALAAYMEETKALDLISFVGLPVAVGDRLYNCAAVVSRGELLALVPKTNLPNYNEFYESRHFAPAPDANETIFFAGKETLFGKNILFETGAVPGLKIACEICEDLWVAASPSVSHCAAGANLIVNLSASDELVGKAEFRRALVSMQSAKLITGYLYADAGAGESGTDMVFAGHNLLCENGRILAECKPFSQRELTYGEIDVERLVAERRRTTTFRTQCGGYDHIAFTLSAGETELTTPPPKLPFVPADEANRRERCRTILNIQSQGLAGRLSRAHAKTAVIGVSGGLDSTLALIVAVCAFDRLGLSRRGIIAVTMPCFGTTARTKGNAEQLAEAFGVTLRCIDIKRAVSVHFEDIGHRADNTDVVYENAQARERTQVLMDIANAEGGLVIGTGDLSELALGFATYNGDHMSMYAVNASVPKTLVRHVVAVYADGAEEDGKGGIARILRDVLATPVSPELLPPKDGEIAQCTEGIVGPYELHDFFLYHFVRFGFTPRKLYRLARASFADEYDGATVKGWLSVFIRRFFAQQFKRSCLPDGPKVGSVSFSPRSDFRMPSDAEVAAWQRSLDEIGD